MNIVPLVHPMSAYPSDDDAPVAAMAPGAREIGG